MSKVKHREQKQLVELLDLEELTQTKTWRMVDAEVATIVLDRPLVVQPMMHQAMLSKSRLAPSTTAAMTSTLTEPTEYVRALKQSLITSKA
jgi:hypothetical protein